MEQPSKKRKRIIKEVSEIEVVDPLEFKANCASENAQKIHTYDELKVELWCDKHYHHRRTFGDSSGERDGIDVDLVQDLIIRSFRYLLDIYLRGIHFSFINYFDSSSPDKKKDRIVLKDFKENGVLNIVAEIHYLDTSQFEVTIITAMHVDNFKISDGQYSLHISNNSVTLNRMIKNTLSQKYKLDL